MAFLIVQRLFFDALENSNNRHKIAPVIFELFNQYKGLITFPFLLIVQSLALLLDLYADSFGRIGVMFAAITNIQSILVSRKSYDKKAVLILAGLFFFPGVLIESNIYDLGIIASILSLLVVACFGSFFTRGGMLMSSGNLGIVISFFIDDLLKIFPEFVFNNSAIIIWPIFFTGQVCVLSYYNTERIYR